MRNLHVLSVLSVICLFSPLTAFGQGTVPVALVTKSTIKNLPRSTVREISHNALQRITVPHVADIVASTQLKTQLMRAITFRREVAQAKLATFTLQESLRTNSPMENFATDHPKWADFIINKSLNRYVQDAMKAADYETVLQELQEYYSLSSTPYHSFIDLPEDVFVSSAMSYIVRHPRKINLRLREVLKSTEIEADLKKEITNFIGQDFLSAQDQKQLAQLLHSAYHQYRAGLIKAIQKPEIQQTLQAYSEVVNAVGHFTAKTGRFPRIASNADEHTLAVKADLLLKQSHLNDFAPIHSAIQQLQLLRNLYPVEILPFDLFIERYRNYVARTNNSTPPYPTMEEFCTPEDNLLYDSYEYYRDHEPQKFKEAIEPILQPLFPPGTRIF